MHFRDSPDSLNWLEIPGNIWFRSFAVTYACHIVRFLIIYVHHVVNILWIRTVGEELSYIIIYKYSKADTKDIVHTKSLFI